MHLVSDDLVPKISAEMNDWLVRPYTRLEVEASLKQISATKTAGVDGLPAVFYQKFWHVVGDDVVESCLELLNGGKSIEFLNHTLISLIPKVGKPKQVFQFRPIALCNVIYKVISKTILNRFKHILPSVISETQSAFVPKRSITDNVLVAFEIIFAMRKKKSAEEGSMASQA